MRNPADNDSLGEAARDSDLTALLLDVCELALSRVRNPDPSYTTLQGEGLQLKQLQAALSALQAALALKLPAQSLSFEMCCDLMLLLIDVAQVCFILLNPDLRDACLVMMYCVFQRLLQAGLRCMPG